MKLDLLRAQKYNLGLLFFEFQCFVERDFYDFVLVSNNIAQNILLKLISGGVLQSSLVSDVLWMLVKHFLLLRVGA